MRILSLETSTELASCALWQDGQSLERTCPIGRPHSETLLPLVRELLEESGCVLQQLDALAFGCGPGSFTGLRVACGAAQGLAVAADLPLIPVITLEAIAWLADVDRCVATLDARMGEVYWARLDRLAKRQVCSADIRVGPPGSVDMGPEDVFVVGNAISVYSELHTRARALGLQVKDILPTAGAVASLAAPRFLAGEGVDAAGAAPLYIRDKVARTIAERVAEGGKA